MEEGGGKTVGRRSVDDRRSPSFFLSSPVREEDARTQQTARHARERRHPRHDRLRRGQRHLVPAGRDVLGAVGGHHLDPSEGLHRHPARTGQRPLRLSPQNALEAIDGDARGDEQRPSAQRDGKDVRGAPEANADGGGGAAWSRRTVRMVCTVRRDGMDGR